MLSNGRRFAVGVYLFAAVAIWSRAILVVTPLSAGEVSKAVARKPVEKSTATKSRRFRSKKNFSTGADPETAQVVSTIDALLRQSWVDNDIPPSKVADDEEWVRRVYLDLVGHIPSLEQTKSFLGNNRKNKRATLIDELLADGETGSADFVRHWTTIWTNLCIGRQTPERTSRSGMQKFFRNVFSQNRPWNEVVSELITAEGHFEENGEVNFLLSQMTMNDEGVQATAKTAKLFLGIQVQCTQCHNHPFYSDWKQNQFWEFNSFFRQARRIDHRKLDPKTGDMVDDYSELVNRQNVEGPVYFEKRSGVMQVAYPRFQGKDIDPGSTTNRREAFAKLVTTVDREALQKSGARPMIADAMVNRLWGHFLGFGFTRPVDDMGPHNSPSHPEILDFLAIEFTKHDFDVRQLIRWICNSEAYNLTSKFGAKNKSDNRTSGEMLYFSHAYVKQLSPEQVFDSLVVSANAHRRDGVNWEQALKRREKWLPQFVTALGTDENDEATTFNGSIPQALMMMNGSLIEEAVSVERGSFLHSVINSTANDSRNIRKLYLSALGRRPTGKEIKAAQSLFRNSSSRAVGYQDLYWALLNSNEFMFVH